jgi:hypothetical protein
MNKRRLSNGCRFATDAGNVGQMRRLALPCGRALHLLELGIPIFHVLLVRHGGGKKGNVLGAVNLARWNAGYAAAPGFGDTVISIDEIVPRDFCHEDRARQICRAHGFFVQTRAAIVENVGDCEEFNRDRPT